MPLNLCRAPSSARGLAVVGSAVLLVMMTPHASLKAQTSTQYEGPVCVAPPLLPENDTWPLAATDDLGITPSPRPVTFTGAQLVSNDIPTNAVTLVSLASTSTNRGKITGSDPYLYTPPAGFAGTDTFAYRIKDAANQATTGIATINVIDVTPPTVRITAPAAGTVSGVVTITASASDNVRIAGVTFFDGTRQIGAEDLRSSYSVSWDSRLVLNGTHNLTAVARDTTGNTATSATVVVNVVNTVTTLTHNTAASPARRLDGID